MRHVFASTVFQRIMALLFGETLYTYLRPSARAALRTCGCMPFSLTCRMRQKISPHTIFLPMALRPPRALCGYSSIGDYGYYNGALHIGTLLVDHFDTAARSG